MNIVKMRTNCDCMVACLAMLMDWTYEETCEYFPPKAVKETGYMWEWLLPYLRAEKIWINFYDSKEAIKYHADWSRPAMIRVKSLISPDKGDHIIFWDGKRVIDPAPEGKIYTELPNEILAVYQIYEAFKN